mgnify:CR=1 FL=1
MFGQVLPSFDALWRPSPIFFYGIDALFRSLQGAVKLFRFVHGRAWINVLELVGRGRRSGDLHDQIVDAVLTTVHVVGSVMIDF